MFIDTIDLKILNDFAYVFCWSLFTSVLPVIELPYILSTLLAWTFTGLLYICPDKPPKVEKQKFKC